MWIFHNKVMKNYDIVVIGAGNAGLIAALQAVTAGKKTLLIEQHNLPGGCASSFRRGRFEIEPSLHELCGVGSTGGVSRIFAELGIDIDWVHVDDCFRVITKASDGSDLDVTMPSGIDNFIEAMEKEVPGSTESVTKLFDLFKMVDEVLGVAGSPNVGSEIGDVLKRCKDVIFAGGKTCQEIFDEFKVPKKAQDILSTYWSYLGIDMENMNILHYASMVLKYVDLGAAIPRHTSHEISNTILEKYRSMGGEIWFNCRANKILFEGDCVCGVETTMGTVGCKACLANINEDILYGGMIPKNLIPDRAKKISTARKQNYSARMITAYFCLDCPAEELGIKDYSIFLEGTADSRKEYLNMMQGFEKNDFSIMLCYNIANPDISPEGTCIISFTTFGGHDEWSDVSVEDYTKLKEKYARKFMRILKEKAGIDFSGHIEEVSLASPWTFARYLGTPEGCVYGHEVTGWDAMMARAVAGGADFPVKGLYPIGAGGSRGDGYSSAYAHGQIVALKAMKDMDAE